MTETTTTTVVEKQEQAPPELTTNDGTSSSQQQQPKTVVSSLRKSGSNTDLDGTGKSVEFSLGTTQQEGGDVEISMDNSTRRSLSKRFSLRRGNSRSSFTSNGSVRSLFSKLGQSFKRSGGQRGGSVEALRGTTGSDFEGNAYISRGTGNTNNIFELLLCFCFTTNLSDTKNIEKFLLIKGPYCFIFIDKENDTTPKYAIPLCHLTAIVQQQHTQDDDSNNNNNNNTNTTTSNTPIHVTLENNLGDIQYELKFSNLNDANEFRKIVKQEAAKAETEMIRKRLGHEHLLTKRKSVLHAEFVGQTKMSNQPEQHTNEETIQEIAKEGFASMPPGI